MLETIAAVVTALGVVFAGVQLRAGQVQRMREFESLYIQRYWSLVDRFPLAAFSAWADYESLAAEERKALDSYVRLCEDQLEMRALGSITTSTYHVWRDGMCASLAYPVVLQAIEESDSPLLLLNELDKYRLGYDPIEVGRAARALRGVG
ncbi:hypothetical protein WIS52_29590 [Pseudonocardia nematodicida]|uniref:Uncharacterized protein n=1 Tax=Pseudonocardia nematodicida TaxID=1206997 RepID=A0ABV1KL31_9PSEU